MSGAGFKVVLVGDICVGKTAIFLQVQRPENYEPELSQPTLNATFAAVKFNVDASGNATNAALENNKSIDPMSDDRKTVKLQLWDTSGDEKFKNLTKQYFQGASAAVIVYDMTDRDTFTAAEDWIQEVRTNAPKDCMLFLASNKSDLLESIEIPKREGKEFADKNGLSFWETSAKENIGVQEMFGSMAF